LAALLTERIDHARDELRERMDGHWTLDDERWKAHDALHIELRESLREYKVSSNEWRQTLNDLSARMLTRTEYEAKHGALEDRIEVLARTLDQRVSAVNDRLSEKIEPLKDARIGAEVERRTTRTVFSDLRVTILLAASIIGVLLAIATYVAAHP